MLARRGDPARTLDHDARVICRPTSTGADSTDAALHRRDYLRALGVTGAVAVGLGGGIGRAGAAMVGNGSHATTSPEGESAPPESAYVTDDVSPPLQPTEWWSPLLRSEFGDNCFWHPGFGTPTDGGLEIGIPSGWSYPGEDGVLSDETDFTLGHSAGPLHAARVAEWNDWHVDARWGAGTDGTLDVTLTQGSPNVFAEYAGGEAVLEFDAAPTVWADQGNALGVSIDGAQYGLFAPTGAEWAGTGTATLTNDLQGTDGSGYLTVALLPDGGSSTLADVERYAYNYVAETEVEPEYEQSAGDVTTEFSFTTVITRGRRRPRLRRSRSRPAPGV